MTASGQTPNPTQSNQNWIQRLRIIAMLVFLLGIIGAEMLYWFETRKADTLADDPSLLANEKAQSRQAEVLLGKSNADFQQWISDFKNHPSQQAALVIIAATLLSGACLFASRLLDNHRG
jgi:hypothetical protein